MSDYFDGNFDGCLWVGPPNASQSVRLQSWLTVDPPAGLELAGTVAVRYTPSYDHTKVAEQTIWKAGVSPNSVTLHRDLNNWWQAIVESPAGTSAAASQVPLEPDTEHTIVVRWTNGPSGTIDINVDGVDATQVAHTRAPAAISTFVIGGDSAWPYYSAFGHIGPMLVSASDKGEQWVDAIQANGGGAYAGQRQLWEKMGGGDILYPLSSDGRGHRKHPFAVPVVVPPLGIIVCEGDSHTAPAAGQDYPAQMAVALGPEYVVHNVAVGGEYLYLADTGEGTILEQAATQVDPCYSPAVPSICVIWGGANDIGVGDIPPQDIYDHVVEYAAARQAVGWKVIALTYLPHYYAPFNVCRNALNALLQADHAFLDGFVDIAADDRIGDDADNGGPYWSPDSIHLNAAGKAVVASLVTPVVRGLL